MTPAGGQRSPAAYGWRVLTVTSVGSVLSALNIAVLNVALPVVTRHFGAGPTDAEWLLLGYMITTTVMMLVFGRLGDMLGRKQLYIGGMVLLVLSSLLCGLAPSIELLHVFRIAQAIGAAALITNTTAILTDAFPPDVLPIGLGVQMTMVAASQVAGPALGGFLAQVAGWRAVFWFNVPIGVVGIVWALVVLRGFRSRRDGGRFDAGGAVLCFLTVAGLIIGLSEGSTNGWGSPAAVIGLAMFVAAGPLFVHRQRTVPAPLIDLRILSSWARSSAYLSNLLLAAVRLAAVILIGLYLQGTQSGRAALAGLVVSSVAAGILLVSPLGGYLARRIAPQTICTAGLCLTAASLAIIATTLSPATPPAVLIVLLFAAGIGNGLFQTPNTTAIMTSVAPERRGIAAAVRSTSQNIGYCLSTAVILGIATDPLSAEQRRSAYQGQLSTLGPDAVTAFTHAVHVAFLVLTGITVVAALISVSRGGTRPITAATEAPAPA